MQRLGLLERCQILPLDVLDERDLDNLVIVDLSDHDRDFAKSDLNGCLISPLTGDYLKTAATLPNRPRASALACCTSEEVSDKSWIKSGSA